MDIKTSRIGLGWSIEINIGDMGVKIHKHSPANDFRVLFRLVNGYKTGLSIQTGSECIAISPDHDFEPDKIVDFDSAFDIGNPPNTEQQAPVAKPEINDKLHDKIKAILGHIGTPPTSRQALKVILEATTHYMPAYFSSSIMAYPFVEGQIESFINKSETNHLTVLEGIFLGGNRKHHLSNAMLVLADLVSSALPFDQEVADYMETVERYKLPIGNLAGVMHDTMSTPELGGSFAWNLGKWLGTTFNLDQRDAMNWAESMLVEFVSRTRTSFGKYAWDHSKQKFLFTWFIKWYMIECAKDYGAR